MAERHRLTESRDVPQFQGAAVRRSQFPAAIRAGSPVAVQLNDFAAVRAMTMRGENTPQHTGGRTPSVGLVSGCSLCG